ncbi:hypothetical protein CCHR01_13011 [Colletotrichum chrysophilum]|uniref:Uncharacterized protein n=1 Tax=Colletotrichum chrysophilum TaxID=1836956 RepID=A0AAD9EDC2_9PEZI|nr:hypothetical protein CCHR01_13011 [Colletotrichum chrysophilum]
MGSSTTTYQTLLQTVFYDSEGYSSLQRTFALPPQTVAFTPPASTCTNFPRSILCNEVKTESITSGVSCWADKFITSSAASFPEECFPTTYKGVQSPAGDDFSEAFTLGYPGTACISGWTPACTTSLTYNVPTGKYVQTWCCPPGGWNCLTASIGPPWRDCTSLLQTPTEVWIRASESGGKTIYDSYRRPLATCCDFYLEPVLQQPPTCPFS